MPTIRIQGNDLDYTDADIITFDEGLIGMPEMRRMVLVSHAGTEPFMWLASLDNAMIAFLVVNPRLLFDDYQPPFSPDTLARLGVTTSEQPLVLSTTTIQGEWTKSTVNLRAPLVVASNSMRAVQVVLTESAYRLDEPMPIALVA